MDMNCTKLIAPKTARVFTFGSLNKAKEIWILLHGYGNAADYFLNKFSSLANENRLLVAPEGLNRFYTKGFSGRVGASWMTKEDRQDDIDDYVRWLTQVYKNFVPPSFDGKIILFGFSQGGATACRFIEKSGFPVDYLVLYASTFPEDVVTAGQLSSYIRKSMIYVLGDKDEYIDSIEKKRQIELLTSTGFNPVVIEFIGGHDIDESVLSLITDKIV
jgi:predicted esterase